MLVSDTRAAAAVVLAIAMAAPVGSAGATSPIKSDEEVVFFHTDAHRDGDVWVVPVHGWIFEPERGSIRRRAFVHTLIEVLGIDDDTAKSELFRRRIYWFIVDNERGKQLPVRIAGLRITTGHSKVDGHFRAEVRVPAERIAAPTPRWLPIDAVTRAGDARRFRGHARLLPATGVSVITDIDDTIKITQVTDRRRVLENTFLREFRAVPDMAALYRGWRDAGAEFHYLSASPWQLFRPLVAFMEQHRFPVGSLALREFRAKDRRALHLMRSPRVFKTSAIEDWLARFPDRRFVLVGDAAELDPEIYGELAQRHPDQIVRVLIRRPPGSSLSAARVHEAFGSASAKLTTFSDPGELPEHIRAGDM